ncbi:hypothetical protein L6R50_15105 [Myxococcota bacterium]|nr:hypothetical protein [Myxococcota bacterium]
MDRVFGMENGGDMRIALTSFGVAAPNYKTLVELREHSCEMYEVEADGAIGDHLGSITPPSDTFEVIFWDDDPYRTRLVYGDCQPY